MMFVDQGRCVGCGACVKVCPEDAISMQNNTAIIAESLCISCGACLDVCPEGAIHPVEIIKTESIQPTIPSTDAISTPYKPVHTPVRSMILPAIGTFLIWTGREIIPRLANYALDAVDRRILNQPQENSSQQGQKSQRAFRNQSGRRGRHRKFRNRMRKQNKY